MQADHVVNLEFMKESLNETLIPYLVIKTSWHKLSTVLGHGGSSFFISRGPKSALTDLAKVEKHTHPGRTHIDYLSKFLSAASSRPDCSDASTSILSAVRNQYSMEKSLIPPRLTEKGSSKIGKRHITN